MTAPALCPAFARPHAPGRLGSSRLFSVLQPLSLQVMCRLFILLASVGILKSLPLSRELLLPGSVVAKQPCEESLASLVVSDRKVR